MSLFHRYVTETELHYIVRDLSREINSLKDDIRVLQESRGEKPTEVPKEALHKLPTQE